MFFEPAGASRRLRKRRMAAIWAVARPPGTPVGGQTDVTYYVTSPFYPL